MRLQKRIMPFLIAGILMSTSCSRVPITHRRQLNLLPESEMLSMSFTNYTDFIKKNKLVPATDPRTKLVEKVGKSISNAVAEFLKEKKLSNRLDGYKWEFHLVDDPKTMNAWCMPGGKVVVYSGILPVTQTESGLAVVLGHEIAHAIARHGNERMSQQLIVQLGGMGLDVALAQKPAQTRDIFLQSYNVGSNVGLLKYSRKQESEADKLGLVFMSIAGYNPEDALTFWQRMKKMSEGKQQLPQFLSTHPSDDTRIAALKAFLPEAKKYYHPAGK